MLHTYHIEVIKQQPRIFYIIGDCFHYVSSVSGCPTLLMIRSGESLWHIKRKLATPPTHVGVVRTSWDVMHGSCCDHVTRQATWSCPKAGVRTGTATAIYRVLLSGHARKTSRLVNNWKHFRSLGHSKHYLFTLTGCRQLRYKSGLTHQLSRYFLRNLFISNDCKAQWMNSLNKISRLAYSSVTPNQ